MSTQALTRKVLFRFVGRFVFAQPHDTQSGVLTVLAVNLAHARDMGSVRHTVALTAPCGCIDPLGSCRPDLMVFSSASATPSEDLPGRIEQGVWFLDGHTVTVPGEKDFQWGTAERPLIEFDELAPDQPRISQSVATAAEPGGPTSAIVRLERGEAVARQLKTESVRMVPLRSANQTLAVRPMRASATEPCVLVGDYRADVQPGKRFADTVEVTVETGPAPLIVTLRSAGSTAPGTLVVLTEPGATTVLTFTNLCTRTSFESFDGEFAGLYEVLDTPPPTRDRPVPAVVENLNGRIDCYTPVRGTF